MMLSNLCCFFNESLLMVFALVCSSFVFDFELLTLICYREIVKAKHKNSFVSSTPSSLPPLLLFSNRFSLVCILIPAVYGVKGSLISVPTKGGKCNPTKYLPVCMNTFIWENIWARANKFGDNISYYCTQVKFVQELGDAPYCPRKSTKNEF